MNFSQEELRKLIETIVKVLEIEEKNKIKKKSMVVVFPRAWDKKYYSLLAKIKKQDNVVLKAVVSDDMDAERISLLRAEDVFDDILYLSEYEKHDSVVDMVLFAVFPRNNCIRLCLGLAEDYIDFIVKRQWEAGKDVAIFSEGLDELSGLEPEHYKKKIESYYREIKNYGIISFE